MLVRAVKLPSGEIDAQTSSLIGLHPSLPGPERQGTSILAGHRPFWWAWEDLNLRPHPYQGSAPRPVSAGSRRQPARTTYRWRPLETVANRSAPMACGPNVDQAWHRGRMARSCPVVDALRRSGPPRPGTRTAGRARQGRFPAEDGDWRDWPSAGPAPTLKSPRPGARWRGGSDAGRAAT